MKKTSTLMLMAVAVLLSITSCSSWKHGDFAERKYTKKFKHTKFEFDKEASSQAPAETEAMEASSATAMILEEHPAAEPVLENRIRPVNEVRAIQEQTAAPASDRVLVKEARELKNIFPARPLKPRFAKAIQKKHQHIAAEPIVEILLAIFLPPIGVLIHDDGITSHFWVSLILTLLFWLPGAIYALLYVTGSIN